MITCNRCKLTKEATTDNFYWSMEKNNFRKPCKACIKIVHDNYRSKHQKEIKEYDKANKQIISERRRKYYLENKDIFLSKSHARYKEKRTEILIKTKQYKELHRDRYKEISRAWCKKKWHSDPEYRMKKIISNSIRYYINSNLGKKLGSILKYLPYSIEDLKNHLQNLWEQWMRWDNFGPYNAKTWDDNNQSTWTWNVDHIKPHSEFKYTTMDCQEFRDCWALSNLRPYSSKQNVIDGKRLSANINTSSP